MPSTSGPIAIDSLSSPIFALPVELLERIFLLASLPPASIRDFDRRFPKEGVSRTHWLWKPYFPDVPVLDTRLVLAHVCRRFRETILSCPSLWAYLSYSMPQSLKDFALEHSRSADLHIDVCNNANDGSYSNLPGPLFLTDLKTFGHRWRSLRVIDVDAFQYVMRQLPDTTLASALVLRELGSFVCRQSNRSFNRPVSTTVTLVIILRIAPKLCCLELWNAMFSGQVAHIPVSAPNLHTLRLNDVLFDGVPAFTGLEFLGWMLGLMPALRNLQITSSLPYADIHSMLSDFPICLEHLEFLSVRVDRSPHDAWFIRQLVCPSLRHLELFRGPYGDLHPCQQCGYRFFSEDDFNEVYDAVIAQNWPLHTLALPDIECRSEGLFHRMAGVTRLAVNSFADFRKYFVSCRDGVGRVQQTASSDTPDEYCLRELAIADLEDPALLLVALEADPPNPLRGLRALYAPKSEFWNARGALYNEVSLLREHMRPLQENSVARAALQQKFPLIDSWPSWANMSNR